MINDYNFGEIKVLITGHTGFKVHGYHYYFIISVQNYMDILLSREGHLFQKANLNKIFIKSIY